MIINFGKYKGIDMSSLPESYLKWLVENIEPCEVREEACRLLNSSDIKQERESKSLEEQANEILGEKPIELLRRRYYKRK